MKPHVTFFHYGHCFECKFCFVWSQLERLRSENTATVAKLLSHLQLLWDRVDLPEDNRCRFLAENSGISQRVVHSVYTSA